MQKYYAQINEHNKCIAVSFMEENDNPLLIALDGNPPDVLGMIWDGEKWNDDPNAPPPMEEEVFDLEGLLTELYFNQMYQMAMAEMEWDF